MNELSTYFTNTFSHSYKTKTPKEYVYPVEEILEG